MAKTFDNAAQKMKKSNVFELTAPQRNIWNVELTNKAYSNINVIISVLRIEHKLNENILKETLNKVVELNDSLRLRFIIENTSIEQEITDFKPINIPTIYLNTEDLSGVIDVVKEEKISPENTFCFKIVYTPKHTCIVLAAHHLITDAWGLTQIGEQIKDIYYKLSKRLDLDDIKVSSYKTLIEREKEYHLSNRFNMDEEFWTNYIKDSDLPKVFGNFDIDKKEASRYSFEINHEIFNSISKYCKKHDITTYAFFLGIFYLYFSKVYSVDEFPIGVPFLNRFKKNDELYSTGMFISTLPLILRKPEKDSFVELCKNISKTNVSLFRHSSFPYSKIQNIYSKKTGISNIFEVGFSYQINENSNVDELDTTSNFSWEFSGEQNNPLTIHVTQLNNRKVLNYDYLTSCFSYDEIVKLNEIFMHLIEQCLKKDKISKIDLLSTQDIDLYLRINNTGETTSSYASVVSAFENIVKHNLNNVALIYKDSKLTYKELNERVNKLASFLVSKKVKNNDNVILFFDKGFDMIVSMFAVLKAGATYVPILPDEDSNRISYIVNDCNPKLILTHKNYDEENTKFENKKKIINVEKIDLDDFKETNLHTIISPNDNAYMIYTSGSTGNPKGTMVMHKNILGLMNSIENDPILKATPLDVSMSLLKYSFDASGIDIYSSLLFGGKLVLVSKEDESNPDEVIRIIEKEQVTRSFLVPKWIEHIALRDKALNANISSLRILGTGGETLKPSIAENLLSKYSNLKVLNLYGPTETTMFSTYKIVNLYEIKNNYTSIGSPIYGSRIAIVNSSNEVLPISCKGELVIYEDQSSIKNIAKGYLHLPESTKERFIKLYNPILKKNVNAYKTGDIAKINDQLEVDFIGRNDDMVKVNGGYLVAINEVNQTIQNLFENSIDFYTVAIPHNNTKLLVLFYVKKEEQVNTDNIKEIINNNISFYMRPKKIVELKEFPRMTSGKINRKALIQDAIELFETAKVSIKPTNIIEKDLYNCIAKVIENDDFSIADDFFDDLGIDSLSLTSIYAELKNYTIDIQDMYTYSNIKDLAEFISTNSGKKLEPDLTNISDVKILNNVKKANLDTVLLTGATGFLGMHILRELLLNNEVKKVYCIVREQLNISAKNRLRNRFDYYFDIDSALEKAFNDKVICIGGDLTEDYFGMYPMQYQELKSLVTLVINSAANVNHFAKPSDLDKANVESVKKLIEFCSNTNITLAHISTLSIAGFKDEKTEDVVFDENKLYIHQSFNNNPYLVSKFNAEKIILEATNKENLNAIIFRLGNIMPRAMDGRFQENANKNVFMLSFKTILDSHLVGNNMLNTKLEFSPVDECARFIVELLEINSNQSIYHILSNKEISVSELQNDLNNMNYNISSVNSEVFKNALNINANEYAKEYIMSNNLNTYSQDITLSKLNQKHLEWSKIDQSYLKNVIDVFGKFEL